MTLSPLGDFALPLHTLQPTDTDVSDLTRLRDLIGGARVVAVGESAHGVREFYQLKHRLLRFLVGELGYTAFVMESGFAEGLAVNDWVLGGDGDLDDIARTGITYGFGECAEMRAQLQWMRAWNAAHDRKVRFYGMDIPGSGASLIPAIRACLARLQAGPENTAVAGLETVGTHLGGITRYLTLSSAEALRVSEGIESLLDRARSQGNEVAVRCALSAQCLARLAACQFQTEPGSNPRDELMADTVHWILRREERILISAHNGHIQRSALHDRPMLGQILAPALGEDMVVLGTTYARGNLLRARSDESFTRIVDVALEPLEIPQPWSVDITARTRTQLQRLQWRESVS